MGANQWKRPDSETLEGIIKARIKSLEMSAPVVAKLAGINAVLVQRFLDGERGINLDTADKICRVLDLVLVTRPARTLAIDRVEDQVE
jgi:succinyl-CoA synthetase beta subunit